MRFVIELEVSAERLGGGALRRAAQQQQSIRGERQLVGRERAQQRRRERRRRRERKRRERRREALGVTERARGEECAFVGVVVGVVVGVAVGVVVGVVVDVVVGVAVSVVVDVAVGVAVVVAMHTRGEWRLGSGRAEKEWNSEIWGTGVCDIWEKWVSGWRNQIACVLVDEAADAVERK